MKEFLKIFILKIFITDDNNLENNVFIVYQKVTSFIKRRVWKERIFPKLSEYTDNRYRIESRVLNIKL